MKPLFVVVSVLATLPLGAADPQPFALAPFRLDSTTSPQLADSDAAFRAIKVRLDLPIGPVRMDYGIPVQPDLFRPNAPRRHHFLDAPGAGYRNQRDRTK